MSKTVFLALLALVCSVAAHAGHGGDMPYGWRNTRAITASTCSTFTCALKGGNCGGDNNYCVAGEYCGQNNMCTPQVAKNDACDVSYENVCSEGMSCVDGSCQRFREVMPGHACSKNEECFKADGDNGVEGTCVGHVCTGRAAGETCAASHQCNAGLFCSASTCQPLAGAGGSCSADDQCASRLNCVSGTCTAHFTVAAGGACETTNDCSAGLYCDTYARTCNRAVPTTTSSVACDISNENRDCPTGHECACRGNGQQATCAAYPGTADNMVKIENDAFACLEANKCGTNTNATFVDCVNSKCAKQFCTYITRSMVEVYSMPECVRARALDSGSFANLLKTCSAYAPGQKSSAGVLSASMFLVALVSAVALLF